METFLAILKALDLGIVALLITVAFFLPKKWVENRFNKEFENFKIQMQSDFYKDLETFKAQLFHQFNLLFSQKTRWQEKELEVLSNVWEKLVNLTMEVSEITRPPRNYYELSDPALNKVMEAMEVSIQYFYRNKIFLEPQLKENIGTVHEEMGTIIELRKDIESHTDIEDRKIAKKAFEKFVEEVIPQIDNIEEMIKEMLFPKEQQDN